MLRKEYIMKFKKPLIISATVLTLAPVASATIVSGVVYASESKYETVDVGYDKEVEQVINKESKVSQLDYSKDTESAKELGISDQLINKIVVNNHNGQDGQIYLVDGVPYDKNGDYITSGTATRGKLSWAVKAIRQVWDKLPKKIKTTIGGYAGLEGILSVVEHYTGALEDAIYEGAKNIGLNDTAAWWVSKTIMLFI